VTIGAEVLVAAGETHRRELLVHCYRMLGSLHDAEDVVQETLLRAWKSADGYDPGRSSPRTWLYRIATNACLTALKDRSRRSMPADLSGPSERTNVEELGRALGEVPWLEPFPDALLPAADPAEIVVARDGVRLAFIAALQHLPPRQRAVIILRDVLALRVAEVAELLDTTPASVNSMAQRARTQLAAAAGTPLTEPDDATRRALLDRYVAAFSTLDVAALTSTLREDAMLQMPPVPFWFAGRADIGAFMATVFARGASYRTLPTRANGEPAVAFYRRREDGAFRFLHVQVITCDTDGIARVDGFHDPDLYKLFGLPAAL
jgi:RNA polymerase sigma-70 factor (ECF subfamily)